MPSRSMASRRNRWSAAWVECRWPDKPSRPGTTKAKHVGAARRAESALDAELAVESRTFELTNDPILSVHHLQPVIRRYPAPEPTVPHRGASDDKCANGLRAGAHSSSCVQWFGSSGVGPVAADIFRSRWAGRLHDVHARWRADQATRHSWRRRVQCYRSGRSIEHDIRDPRAPDNHKARGNQARQQTGAPGPCAIDRLKQERLRRHPVPPTIYHVPRLSASK